MRFIGILLIIAGVLYTIAGPLFGTGSSGDQVAKTRIFDRSNYDSNSRGWKVSKVLLEVDKNPLAVQLNFSGSRDLDDVAKLKLLVRLAPVAQDGSTLSAIVNQPVTVDLGDAKTVTIADINIERTGTFRLGAFPVAADNVTNGAPDLEIDQRITAIDVLVLSNYGGGGSTSFMGIGLVVLGIIIVSFAGRRSSRAVEEEVDVDHLDDVSPNRESTAEIDPKPEAEQAPPEKTPPKRETDVGKTIKWGRDANQD